MKKNISKCLTTHVYLLCCSYSLHACKDIGAEKGEHLFLLTFFEYALAHNNQHGIITQCRFVHIIVFLYFNGAAGTINPKFWSLTLRLVLFSIVSSWNMDRKECEVIMVNVTAMPALIERPTMPRLIVRPTTTTILSQGILTTANEWELQLLWPSTKRMQSLRLSMGSGPLPANGSRILH